MMLDATQPRWDALYLPIRRHSGTRNGNDAQPHTGLLKGAQERRCGGKAALGWGGFPGDTGFVLYA